MRIQIQRGLMPEFENNIRPKFANIIDHFPCNDHDFDKIINYLYQEHIIDVDDMEELEKFIKSKKARELLLTLKNRGDRAYGKFVEALKEYNFLGILEILEVGSDNRGPRESMGRRILTKIGEKRYPKTRAFACGFSKLKKLGVLGIIGSAGDGKSILSRMIANANDYKNHVPEILTQPDDCQLRTLDDRECHIMVIDDMLSESFLNAELISQWEAHFEKLKLLVDEGQLVIIYTMRDYVYNYTKYKLQKYDLFSNEEARIFLHKGELTLNENERDEMMKFHGVLDDESESLRNYPDFGFPAIVGNSKRQSENPKYSSHLFFLKTELETFWKEDKIIYSALFILYIMGKGDLSQEKSEVFVKAKETVKKLHSSFEETESYVVDIWRELSESFVCVTEPEIYTLRGNVAQAFMLHLSERRLDMALENSPLDLLLSMTEVEKSPQMMSKVYVPTKCYPVLAARFLSEITLNNLNVFRHPAFLKNEFLEILLDTDSDGILMTIKDIDLCTIDSKPDKGNIFHFIAKFCSAQSLDMLLRRRRRHVIYFHTTSLGYNCCQLIANSHVESANKVNVLKWRKFPGLASMGSESWRLRQYS